LFVILKTDQIKLPHITTMPNEVINKNVTGKKSEILEIFKINLGKTLTRLEE